ncbi:MAG: trans-2-enoyl-CoA reductase family protein [Lachnospiraceae bacterium]|nr:trans-2-enoyl-CoA reductase family protein [Lachnospiraceae bacterium]
MIVEPKVKGFICITAHPEGCKESVRRQIEYVKARRTPGQNEPKKVLVIGASTGYGLASRISAAFGYGAATLGIMFEKEASEKRTATPGYYNTRAMEQFAKAEGLYAESINGDAFSEAIKQETIEKIKKDLGQVDMVIYSLAAPRRTDKDGTTYNSVLKTVGSDYTNKTLDLRNNQITEVTVTSATEEEIAATVKVMGGEDWKDWIQALSDAGVLAENATTVAYSYIGPEMTHPIYFAGTIGQAKKHLEQTAKEMREEFASLGLKSYVSVNKGLVTQASSAIPIVPLYMSMLYKVMKEQGLHEDCIAQMERMFRERLTLAEVPVDEEGRIRMDDYEMRPEVQEAVKKAWEQISTENVHEYADIDGYFEDFYHMFGFHYDNVDYTADVDIM